MEERWTNKMRQKMEGYEEPAPQGLWDDIEKSMNLQQPAPVPAYKKYVLWTTGLSAAAAAIVAVALFFGNDSQQSLTPIDSPQPQLAMEQTPTQKTPTPLEERLSAESETYLAANLPTPAQKASVLMTPEHANTVVVSDEVAQQEVVQEDEKPSQAAVPRERKQKAMQSVPQRAQQQPLLASPSNREQTTQRRHFSAGVYAGNLPHSSRATNNYSEFVTGNILPHDLTHPQQSGKTPVSDIIYSNLGKKVETHKKHRLPVKFGLSFRYQFNDRWSIESGLNYTYLSADLTAGSVDHHYRSKQRLQYLGIPLNVNFDFWKNRHWNFYASAGGSMDKCIHGKLDTDYVLNNKLAYSESKSVMEKPLQFAVNGALGAQWNITQRFGLYAEPGMVYYFDNGSPIETIYKDRPFNFNFKLGLRLTFR